MELLALRIGESQDQHVLSHPALAMSHRGGNPQSETLLAQQRIAAVTRSKRPDQIFFREVGNVLLFDRSTGPGNVLLAFRQGSANRVQARNEIAILAQRFQNLVPYPCHDVHVRGDVGRIADLNPDLGDRRTNRSHREGDDVHGPPLHATGIEFGHRLLQLNRIDPVVGGTRILFIETGDVRACFYPSDVARITAEQVTVGTLGFIELGSHPRADHQLH